MLRRYKWRTIEAHFWPETGWGGFKNRRKKQWLEGELLEKTGNSVKAEVKKGNSR